MNPENVPMGDRILPNEVCEECGERLVILNEAGDEQDTIYIGCPNTTGENEHTEHNGQPRETLIAWGWDI